MTDNRIYGGCIICGTVVDICAQCGHCPEHHADAIVDAMVHASPEKMNSATTKWRQRGGKFAVFADVLSGLISLEEADRRFDALEAEGES